jgi:hypothetical protein
MPQDDRLPSAKDAVELMLMSGTEFVQEENASDEEKRMVEELVQAGSAMATDWDWTPGYRYRRRIITPAPKTRH